MIAKEGSRGCSNHPFANLPAFAAHPQRPLLTSGVPGMAPAFLSSVRTEGGRNLDASLYKKHPLP